MLRRVGGRFVSKGGLASFSVDSGVGRIGGFGAAMSEQSCKTQAQRSVNSAR